MPRRQKIALGDAQPAIQAVIQPIVVTQEGKLTEWLQSLDCSEADLLEAMSAVGNSAQAVRNYLHGGKGPWQWVAAT